MIIFYVIICLAIVSLIYKFFKNFIHIKHVYEKDAYIRELEGYIEKIEAKLKKCNAGKLNR